MKELQKIFFLIIGVLCLNNYVAATDIKEISENFIRKSCGDSSDVEFKQYIIEKSLKNAIEQKCQQKFFRDEVIYWEIKDNSELKYIAIIDNVYGKALPITFLVIFNLDGIIKSSAVVKYREQHGGAVANENWQRQFVGKNGDSDFEIGNDVQSISGATISVNSITKGIKKLSILFEEILKIYET